MPNVLKIISIIVQALLLAQQQVQGENHELSVIDLPNKHLRSKVSNLLDPIGLTAWQGWIPPDYLSNISNNELAVERKKADALSFSHWVMVGKVLHHDGISGGLETKEEMGDFEFLAHWRQCIGGEFSIFLRGIPGPLLWSKIVNLPDGETLKGSGELFLNKRFISLSKKEVIQPAGNWNQIKIRMIGDRTSVWVNGTLAVFELPLENSWDRRKPIPTRGAIVLQSRGTPIDFKDLILEHLHKK